MVLVKFDKKVYGLGALKKAAYKFMDKVAVNIADHGDSFEVEMRFSKESSKEAQEHFISEFTKEVLDQDLRESIKKETEGCFVLVDVEFLGVVRDIADRFRNSRRTMSLNF